MRHRTPQRRTVTLAAVSVCIAAGLAAGADRAHAQSLVGKSSVDGKPFAEVAALPERTLESQRGGLRIDGFDIDFAVRIETRINERLRIVSTLLADAKERIDTRMEILEDRVAEATALAGAAADSVAASLVASAAEAAAETGAEPPAASASTTPARTAATPAQSRPAPTVIPVRQARTVPAPTSQRPAPSDPQPQAQRRTRTLPAATVAPTDRPSLSVRHVLEGTLGTRVVNRLNNQNIVNRVDMTITLRNYEAIRQQAQRARAMSTALRAATAGR
jgi:hypothetical protein